MVKNSFPRIRNRFRSEKLINIQSDVIYFLWGSGALLAIVLVSKLFEYIVIQHDRRDNVDLYLHISAENVGDGTDVTKGMRLHGNVTHWRNQKGIVYWGWPIGLTTTTLKVAFSLFMLWIQSELDGKPSFWSDVTGADWKKRKGSFLYVAFKLHGMASVGALYAILDILGYNIVNAEELSYPSGTQLISIVMIAIVTTLATSTWSTSVSLRRRSPVKLEKEGNNNNVTDFDNNGKKKSNVVESVMTGLMTMKWLSIALLIGTLTNLLCLYRIANVDALEYFLAAAHAMVRVMHSLELKKSRDESINWQNFILNVSMLSVNAVSELFSFLSDGKGIGGLLGPSHTPKRLGGRFWGVFLILAVQAVVDLFLCFVLKNSSAMITQLAFVFASLLSFIFFQNFKLGEGAAMTSASCFLVIFAIFHYLFIFANHPISLSGSTLPGHLAALPECELEKDENDGMMAIPLAHEDASDSHKPAPKVHYPRDSGIQNISLPKPLNRQTQSRNFYFLVKLLGVVGTLCCISLGYVLRLHHVDVHHKFEKVENIDLKPYALDPMERGNVRSGPLARSSSRWVREFDDDDVFYNTAFSIVIPSFPPHKEVLQNLLRSMEKYCIDCHKTRILIMPSSHEMKAFSDLKTNFPKFKRLELVSFADVYPHVKNSRFYPNEEEFFKDKQKSTFQSMKKLTGCLYMNTTYCWMLDSESFMFQNTSLKAMAKRYFLNPYFLYSSTERSGHFATSIAKNILGFREYMGWVMEEYLWIMELDILAEIKSILDAKFPAPNDLPVLMFFEVVYFVYILHNRHHFPQYKIIDTANVYGPYWTDALEAAISGRVASGEDMRHVIARRPEMIDRFSHRYTAYGLSFFKTKGMMGNLETTVAFMDKATSIAMCV
ncbi:hypothetical protein HDU97_001813, partial [Phlyctochytrium planicorne]